MKKFTIRLTSVGLTHVRPNNMDICQPLQIKKHLTRC